MPKLLNKDKQKRFFWKKFQVHSKFQWIFLFVNLGILLSTILFIGIQVSRTYGYLNQLGVDVNLEAGHPFFKFIELQKSILIQDLWAIALLSVIFLVIVSVVSTLILTHRVAGPFIRLKSYFKALSETAEVKPLSFRKGDFFDELPGLINDALQKIKKSLKMF